MADINASLQEALRLSDINYGAARFVASQNTRTAALLENPAKLADGPVAPRLNPQPVAAGAESARVSDTASAILDLVQAVPAEAGRLADSVVASLPVLQAVPADALKMAEAVQAALLFDLAVAAGAEGAKVADTATATLNPRPVSVAGEGARLSDTVAATLDPLRASVAEAVLSDDTELFSLDVYPPAVLRATDAGVRRYYAGGMISSAQAQQQVPE